MSIAANNQRNRSEGLCPVVVVANDPWDTQPRRKQRLYARLATQRPVFYMDPPSSLLDILRGKRFVRRDLGSSPQISRREHELRVVSGSWEIPGEYYSGDITLANGRLHRRWLARAIRHVVQQENLSEISLVHYWPLFHPLNHACRVRATAYDVIDDYAALTPFKQLGKALDRAAEELASAADVTVTVNRSLAQRFENHAGRLELLPHGVDTDLFHPRAYENTPFEALRAEKRVKAVFHGTIDHRLDEVTLMALLRAGVTLLLAGQVGWRGDELKRMKEAGDCRTFGVLDQPEVAALVSAADVGIIPFWPLPGLDPVLTLKRLEFYACELPIVASGLNTGHDTGNELIRATGAADFVRAVQEAESRSVLDGAARRALAAEHSWGSIAQRFGALL